MALDPRQPVLVGVGQLLQRQPDLEKVREPLLLMGDALELAGADAGSRTLLGRLDLVVVVRGRWNYGDPGRLLAERVGARRARSALTAEGGNAPQSALNALCRRIQAGELDAAAVVGAEGIYSRRKMREAGMARSNITQQRDARPDELLGHDFEMLSDEEQRHHLRAPLQCYALFENAIRAARGETVEGHRDRVSAMWAHFNEVACANPYAWLRRPLTADQIRDEGTGNPMVAFPYTKSMASNWFTDQAAGFVLCSADTARRAGVPRDRWVFPHAGSDAMDTQFVTNRPALPASAGMRHGGRAALELAGASIDDVAHIDLYSCFPSAVQVAMAELGVGADREVTLTGGLGFFGGPMNNYVSHSLACMVEVLRARPGDLGLVTANGGMLTKHAFTVYSTEPPAGPFRWVDVQDRVDAEGSVSGAPGYSGPGVVEASTVSYVKGEPAVGIVALRTPDGARAFAHSTEASLVEALTTVECAGRPVAVDADGGFDLPAA